MRYYHRKVPLGDNHSYAQLTRFLPPELFPLFERTGCGFGEPGSLTAPPGTPVTQTVHERLGGSGSRQGRSPCPRLE